MQKHTFKIIISLAILGILLVVLIPYFTASFARIREQKAAEVAQQELLQQEQAAKEAAAKAAEKIYLLGQFDPAQMPNFATVPAKYDISGHTIYLRQETLAAFTSMAEAALKDGITLTLASATRNFDYQKDLWDDKWEGVTLVDGKKLPESTPDGLARFKKILEYSAVPGTSRHHWGTDIDINAATPEYFDTDEGKEVYDWMTKNAPSFGFCQPYTAGRSTGYDEEKWHWSYLPLSKTFTEEYKSLITDDDIKGFDGDQYVAGQDLIDNYVLGINPECL